ncbi:hypothetical protein D0Y60_20785 [Shinella sp. WSJ-2]|uniref:hypothetical protein n=1 Tax=Shinella sp. WSJ-2 TaxID=2303749 RepID=UPI000E3E9A65|nr:hypothetical protein [Shinella sp. WSJ-2]RFZ83804.1 hypothetical protein D0Y60_20785 [Shinella sp. WSJ-2]
MTKRFDELYIPRGEHREVVSFYQKVVAHLYRKLQEMRAEADERALHRDGPTMRDAKPQLEFFNVVRINFGPRRSG